jgi:hypothetical protein
MNFLLFTLTLACKELEQRIGYMKSPRGEKTESVIAAVDRQAGTFSVADLQAECPGVGLDLIRRVLARLQKEKKSSRRALAGGRNGRKLETRYYPNKLGIKLRIEIPAAPFRSRNSPETGPDPTPARNRLSRHNFCNTTV